MASQIQEIAARVRMLREIQDITPEQCALEMGISADTYLSYETGEVDIPASFLLNFAKTYGTSLTALLTGIDARLHAYALTRAGEGVSVDRRKEYKYQHLAYHFAHKKAEPFLVTVEPAPEDVPVSLNSHPGQEFDYVLEGCLRITIDGKEVTLEPGDSLYYDSTLPHGMQALNGTTVRFLAVIF